MGKGNLAELKKKYKKIVDTELEGKCKEVLDLPEKNLVKGLSQNVDEYKNGSEDSLIQKFGSKEQAETQVFYLKMCGDYYRYLAEFSEKENYKESAGLRYKQALDIAKGVLAPTHPTRLGLALNASV